MNFPKPVELSPETVKRYISVWTRRLTATELRHPELRGVAIVVRVVDDLIESKPTITHNTYNQYKAASLFMLNAVIKRRPADDPALPIILSVIDRLTTTSSDGCIRKSDQTSALKAKRLPSRDLEAIERDIRERAHRLDLALPTIFAMTILRLTGARPCELLRIKSHCCDPGTVDVTIQNAKASNGRGLGKERSFQLRELTEDEVAAFIDWPGTLKELATRYSTEMPFAGLSKCFSRAARRALGKRRKYPTLYSLRHQFAADAKAAGLTPEEIAALMGHASDVTAMRHYGRRISGQGGFKAHANQASVAKVRRKAKSFQSPSYGEAAKTGPSGY